MTEYAMASSIEKADIDTSIYGATVELENQIARLGSIISELDEKASRHMRPQPEALNIPNIPSPPDIEKGATDAAKRQWDAANDVRRLATRLESLVYRLDLL